MVDRARFTRPGGETRLDVHNARVIEGLAEAGLCGKFNLITGGVYRLPSLHEGGCDFYRICTASPHPCWFQTVSTYSTDLDFGAAFAAPSSCPHCGSHELRAACHDDQAVFLCSACGQGWQVEMGRVTKADTAGTPTASSPT